jgi:4-carboxymuconolactone decarboxylase
MQIKRILMGTGKTVIRDSKNRSRSKRESALIRRMMAARYGKILPTHRLLAATDLEFTEAYEKLFEILMTKDRTLSVKTKELVAIGILSTKGQFEALETHIRRALRIGVTSKQILEVLEVAMLYGGTESLIFGADSLATQKVKQEGIMT